MSALAQVDDKIDLPDQEGANIADALVDGNLLPSDANGLVEFALRM